MSKLKIGIIGCGGISNGKHMPALSRLSDKVEMVAFCDIIVERAQEAAKSTVLRTRRCTRIIISCSRTRALMSCMC